MLVLLATALPLGVSGCGGEISPSDDVFDPSGDGPGSVASSGNDPWSPEASNSDPDGPSDAAPGARNGDGPLYLPSPSDRPPPAPAPYLMDELERLPKGAEQWTRFCNEPLDPGADDIVRRAFCGETKPTITGLRDLIEALGLDPDLGPGTKLTLAAHSTSVSMRSVSPINPRVFVYTHMQGPTREHPGAVILSYVRGEPYVEIAALDYAERDDTRGERRNFWNFYLVRIERPCLDTGNCLPADWMTDAYELEWSGITVYEDLALVDTALDCRGCHVPRDTTSIYVPAGQPVLLFAERRDPWTHWFTTESEEGAEYIAMLRELTGDGSGYGFISDAALEASDPESLWRSMYFSFHSSHQPREYDPGRIARELEQTGMSPTWEEMFRPFRAGRQNPPPHYAKHVTDPERVGAAIAAYRALVAGSASPDQLPDFRDVFDAAKLVELGHLIEPLATPEETLVNACGQCHHGSVDPASTRAVFNVEALDSLGAADKQLIGRLLHLPLDDPRHMPPARYRVLSPAALAQLDAYFTGGESPIGAGQ